MRWVTRQWVKLIGKKWDFKCRQNVVRVSQERTWEGKLFQIVGAAERKPRAPNEMLQRVTDRRLAEADHRLAKYGWLPVCIALWVIAAWQSADHILIVHVVIKTSNMSKQWQLAWPIIGWHRPLLLHCFLHSATWSLFIVLKTEKPFKQLS